MEYLAVGILTNFIATISVIIIHIIYIYYLEPMERYRLLLILKEMRANNYDLSGMKSYFPLMSFLIPFYKVYIIIIHIWFLFRATNDCGVCKEALIYAVHKSDDYSIVNLKK